MKVKELEEKLEKVVKLVISGKIASPVQSGPMQRSKILQTGAQFLR